jgi:hypothetical protein
VDSFLYPVVQTQWQPDTNQINVFLLQFTHFCIFLVDTMPQI